MAARHFTDTCDRICLLLYQSAGAEYPFSRLLVFCDPDGICIRNCIIVPLRLEKRACFLREKGAGYQKGTMGPYRYLFYLGGVLLLIFLIGSVLSSPIINAKKYQKLMQVEERDFTADIKEVDFNTIPFLTEIPQQFWAAAKWVVW